MSLKKIASVLSVYNRIRVNHRCIWENQEFFSEHATIKNLHQVEIYIPDPIRPLGSKTIIPEDVDVSGVLKTWYLNVPIWCSVEENKMFTDPHVMEIFHRVGLHATPRTQIEPISQYIVCVELKKTFNLGSM